MKKEEIVMGLYAMRLQGKNRVAQERNNTVDRAVELINQLDEPEKTLEQEAVDELIKKYSKDEMSTYYVKVERERFVKDLQNLLVPKQEEVGRAYKDGYEKGKKYTFYKGYLEGLADKESEPETVADVLADFHKSLERFKKVLGTKVEELEE